MSRRLRGSMSANVPPRTCESRPPFRFAMSPSSSMSSPSFVYWSFSSPTGTYVTRASRDLKLDVGQHVEHLVRRMLAHRILAELLVARLAVRSELERVLAGERRPFETLLREDQPDRREVADVVAQPEMTARRDLDRESSPARLTSPSPSASLSCGFTFSVSRLLNVALKSAASVNSSGSSRPEESLGAALRRLHLFGGDGCRLVLLRLRLRFRPAAFLALWRGLLARTTRRSRQRAQGMAAISNSALWLFLEEACDYSDLPIPRLLHRPRTARPSRAPISAMLCRLYPFLQSQVVLDRRSDLVRGRSAITPSLRFGFQHRIDRRAKRCWIGREHSNHGVEPSGRACTLARQLGRGAVAAGPRAHRAAPARAPRAPRGRDAPRTATSGSRSPSRAPAVASRERPRATEASARNRSTTGSAPRR